MKHTTPSDGGTSQGNATSIEGRLAETLAALAAGHPEVAELIASVPPAG